MAETTTPTMEEHALNQGSTFVWHELYVPNPDAAIDFYVNALGFGKSEMPMGDQGSYMMLTKNGKGVAGVMSTSEGPAQGAPTHWAAYIAVDDVDARIEKCTQMGATVVVPAMDVPSVGRMALIADPQGAHIWLYKDAM
jgi:predicted enzyme related to lactoylglutathione lyase